MKNQTGISFKKNSNNVVVTGMGLVTALGYDLEHFFNDLCSGKDGTGSIINYKTEPLSRKNAAQIKYLLPVPDKWKNYNRTAQMALIAVKNSIDNSGLMRAGPLPEIGISNSTMSAGIPEIVDEFCADGGFFHV